MNKVICDICGTIYPESADCCPICGSSREYAELQEEIPAGGMPEYIPEKRMKGGLFSAADRLQQELYDFSEPEEDEEQDIREWGNVTQQNHPQTNWILVVLLTILITLLLLGSCYLFFRYYLPNKLSPETVPTTQEITTEETEEPTTTELVIPCRSIALTAGVPELTRLGQYWLMHVIAMPEDTTDKLTFVSADESIVTVTEEGRLCAVGEGQTTIVITCGDQEIICPITVRLPETEASGESSATAAAGADAETAAGGEEPTQP